MRPSSSVGGFFITVKWSFVPRFYTRYCAGPRCVSNTSAVMALPAIAMASSIGAAILISSLPVTGSVPTFLGVSSATMVANRTHDVKKQRPRCLGTYQIEVLPDLCMPRVMTARLTRTAEYWSEMK